MEEAKVLVGDSYGEGGGNVVCDSDGEGIGKLSVKMRERVRVIYCVTVMKRGKIREALRKKTN